MATLSLVQFHDQVKRLTVFPFVAMMVAFLPLICVTSPSIHASSGSSTQTCDPTMMFTGVPWTNHNKARKSVTVNTWSDSKKVGRINNNQQTTQRKLLFFFFLSSDSHHDAATKLFWSWNSEWWLVELDNQDERKSMLINERVVGGCNKKGGGGMLCCILKNAGVVCWRVFQKAERNVQKEKQRRHREICPGG